MEIMSISLDKETLQELNEIQENLGFRSRSKVYNLDGPVYVAVGIVMAIAGFYILLQNQVSHM